jgi:hypothetical protein
MAAEPSRASIVIRGDQPLVGVFVEDDADLVEYFADDAAPSPLSRGAQEALSGIGAWRDMDWDDLADSLDRIRHESTPTPPIEL